jgi:hypothetical protein
MALGAWGLALGPWFVEAWSLKLLAINPDPGAKALPVITHDLELSCDGQQLARCSVTNFYSEFFSQGPPYIVLESTS